MHKKEENFNDWSKQPIFHKSKIINFDFLVKNDCLTLIEDDYYFLSKDLDHIKSIYYDQEVERLSKELEITDVTS